MSIQEQQRDALSKALINEASPTRYVVGAEGRRVEELLDERYTDPYAGEPRLINLGRSLLAKAGLHHPPATSTHRAPLPRR